MANRSLFALVHRSCLKEFGAGKGQPQLNSQQQAASSAADNANGWLPSLSISPPTYRCSFNNERFFPCPAACNRARLMLTMYGGSPGMSRADARLALPPQPLTDSTHAPTPEA
jgi:hypothetical protein